MDAAANASPSGTGAGGEGQSPKAKRAFFDTIVTSTPVLLTVIATFLVGQSTGEMTRAQYFRSVASQNQSKVADQWGFFQAKRIRGQILEGNADLLMAQGRDPFTEETLFNAAASLVLFAKEAKNSSPDAKKQPREVADEWAGIIADAERAEADIHAFLLSKDESTLKSVQGAFEAVKPKSGKSTAPKVVANSEATSEIDPTQAAMLKQVIQAIKSRKPENDIAPIALQLTEETLAQALKEAEHRADEVYQRGKKIENVLEKIDALIERQTALVFAFQQLIPRSGIDGKLRRQYEDSLRELHARLHGDYKAARHAFSARRYEEDARSNQESAYLYEVQVHLNSARSDKHLFRSKMFLLAMLVAQAGVTIATLAIAVRRKSIFWLLATLTGLIAIGFGLYVYLDLGPVPMM